MIRRIVPLQLISVLGVATRGVWMVLQWAAPAAVLAGPVGWLARAAMLVLRAGSSVLATGLRRTWRQPEEWTAFSARRPRTYGLRAMTGPILMLGDNQLQHAFGDPDSSSNLSDRWSEPSTRPALGTLFGELLLEDAIERQVDRRTRPPRGNRMPIVHMGDALNTSCQAEWIRYKATIETAIKLGNIGPKRPFVMLPGNHDGFLYGNFAAAQVRMLDGPGAVRKLLRMLTTSQWPEWTCRCADPLDAGQQDAGPLPKSAFIERYLDLLVSIHGADAAQGPELATLLAGLGTDPSSWRLYRPAGNVPGPSAPTNADSCQPSAPFLVAALAHVDRVNPTGSFIVQLLRWPSPDTGTRRRWRVQRSGGADAGRPSPPPVFALALDTCDYPVRFLPAGTSGGLGALQLAVAERLLQRSIDRSTSHPTLVTFFGHHNLDAVQAIGRWRFGRLVARLARDPLLRVVPLFVSAHRHRGGWLRSRIGRHPFDSTETLFADLNVSSLVDWPLATREVALNALPDGWSEHSFVVRSRQHAYQPDDTAAHDVVEQARRIALLDVLGQRRNRLRLPVPDRVRAMMADPTADAVAAEIELMEAMSLTLQRLIGQPQFRTSLSTEDRGGVADVEQQLAKARRSAAEPKGRAPKVVFEELRHANHAATALIRKSLGTARERTPMRDLLRAAIAEAAREDYARQWMAQATLLPAIADRWYRRAGNLDERYALLDLVGRRRRRTGFAARRTAAAAARGP